MKVEFHPSTVNDVNEAAGWYGRARPGLGNDFRAEIDSAVERISQNPMRFPAVEAQIRRCIVHRFPYSVLYRVIDSDRIRILAIRHHRRDPRIGLRRS